MNRKARRAIAGHSQRGMAAGSAVSTLFLQAVTLLQSQKLDEAETLYRKVLSLDPNHAGSLNHLGVIARARGDLEKACDLISRSLTIQPEDSSALVNLSGVLRLLGEYDEAISACRKAITAKPDSHEAYSNLGSLLLETRKPHEALVAFEQVLKIAPPTATAYLRLGLALAEVKRTEEASEAYEKAVALDPNSAKLHVHLANGLLALNRDAPASEAFKKAIALDPEFAPAYTGLAAILQARSMFREALVVHEELRKRQPDNHKNNFASSFLRNYICDWNGLAEEQARLLEAEASFVPFSVMCMNSTPQQQFTFARRWADQMGGPSVILSKSPAVGAKRQKLRLGYLSGDFNNHATVHLLAELIERHDRSKFDVSAYCYSTEDGSRERARIRQAFDHFTEIRDMTDGAAARRIHADGVDILVDLKGYTRGTRSQILKWRPAPIQVNYLGYPGTLGNFADYIIADAFIAPMDHHSFYSEKIVHLPGSYQPNDTKKVIGEVPSRAMCGLPEGAFVFCSFNNTYKINPPVFDIWMRLLKAVPNSVLWLLEANPLVKENLRREASRRGVAAGRIVFAPKLDLAKHLARHVHADLFLDTLPVNAHTTASDALWTGLPVLTCAGDIFIGRVAGSLLNAVGLPELVTHSLEDYEALALKVAQDPQLLRGLRERLAANRLTAPLFDIERYTGHLESAFSRMWSLHESGEAPRAFAVQPIQTKTMENA